MATKEKNYDSQSISSLKGADRVRKRPAVIFGSDGLEGCEHSFFEILSNSIDEHREGFGKVINITVYNDNTLSVEDFGRGVPLGWNENEKRFNWELVYCELYAGGKYKNTMGGAYEYSLGLNGLGACATQYSSEFMEVVSYYDGEKHTMSFKKGEPVGKLETEPCPKSKTGTLVKWKPDREVFTEIKISREYFNQILLKQAVVNAGLRLTLKFQNPDGSFSESDYLYPEGIVDYINERVGETAMMPVADYSTERVGRDRDDKEDYKLKSSFAFTFSNDVNFIEYYHNSSFLEHGGSPEKATRSAFVSEIDKYLKATNKYTKNESKITFADVEDSLVLVTNSFSTQTSYANQTKKAITNSFIAEAMTDFFKHSLEVYFAENPQYADKVCLQVLVNKRSRESAEVMRTNVKKKLTGTLDISNSVEKFVGCRSKDPTKRELFIVEGNSALSSCKLARNAEFQAIIPVRGKTLNCLKSTYEKIFKNDIIMDLLKVIGCGIEIKTKSNKNFVPFDMSLLKWDKIIICTDADEDGYQIRTLILTMFYRLLPTLIQEGKVYIAQTPLYEITTKDDTFFAYDEQEKTKIIEEIGEKKYTIQRSKGLGENEPEMMSRTTMKPETRKLIRITPEDEKSTTEMFEVLLGDNVADRKRYIYENGSRYLELADIS
ncbi:MAG: toprim domain-containing protein [Eubacteriales bacterium]|nr:toprim domain-containing protein [Eubacteriales bacterium]MDD4474529.1 toprim domain-containing protein [Eubacteriales bacterium]